MTDYKSLIKNKSEITKPEEGRINSDLGRALNVSKFAVHWMTLKPGQKSSSPHAENTEEEFLFVIKGDPHVWINGYIYQLHEGYAVGFPAGTGIAHAFINNTKEDVEFAVLGDKTKTDNKCIFPINPEMKAELKDFWWSDAPAQELGPHDGVVGNLNHQRSLIEIPFIKSIHDLKRGSYSYPGDKETFTQGIRITDHVGLKVVAVWSEILSPKSRSSWPHAHKDEEEFVLILKGHPQVWLNGFIFDLKPGDGVFFPPGSNIAHTVLNNTDEDVHYLGIGECDDGGKDQVYYPLHPHRNLEVVKENFFWENRPRVTNFGNHNGQPS
ncbi:MAG: cupin domain-containing protein [Bdellovibrio sp.]|nr:cupin domain-containing protein [Bdellovibrio sp.]